eukprot:765340-Hanusia_phi.AAC.2
MPFPAQYPPREAQGTRDSTTRHEDWFEFLYQKRSEVPVPFEYPPVRQDRLFNPVPSGRIPATAPFHAQFQLDTAKS